MSKYEEKMSPKELVEFFSKGSRGAIFILTFDFLLWLASFTFSFAIYEFFYDYFLLEGEVFTTLTQNEKNFLAYLILSHILLFSLLFFSLFRIFIVNYFELFDKKIKEKKE